MQHAPPTSPGPSTGAVPIKSAASHSNWIGVGVMIHAGCAALTSFIVPFAGGSNIAPIAGVMWAVLTTPAAAATGALSGWLVRNHRAPIAIGFLIATAAIIATAIVAIILKNW